MSLGDHVRKLERQFADAMAKAGHEPRLIEDDDDGVVGTIDFKALYTDESGGHNGPACRKCGASWCVHCWDGSPLRTCTAV